MALIVCPECQHQMSDTAAACPKCGWARAAIESATHAAQAKSVQHAEGTKLVQMSTRLMLLGFIVMLGGCGITIGVRAGPVPAVTGVGLGFAILVVAAVVGQIGRAKQGRIV